MPEPNKAEDSDAQSSEPRPPNCELKVTFRVAEGRIDFDWVRLGTREIIAQGQLAPSELKELLWFRSLNWHLRGSTSKTADGCSAKPASTRAMIARIRKLFPVEGDALDFGVVPDTNLGNCSAGRLARLKFHESLDRWKWLESQLRAFARLSEEMGNSPLDPAVRSRRGMYALVCAILGVAPNLSDLTGTAQPSGGSAPVLLDLLITFDLKKCMAEFRWSGESLGTGSVIGKVRALGPQVLSWELERNGARESNTAALRSQAIRMRLNAWLEEFPTKRSGIRVRWLRADSHGEKPEYDEDPPFSANDDFALWLEENLLLMGETKGVRSSVGGGMMPEAVAISGADFGSYAARYVRREERRAEEEILRRENMARLAEQRRQKSAVKESARREAERARKAELAARSKAHTSPANPQIPLPQVPCIFETPPLAFQDTVFPLTNLRGVFLRERAALWWISNQSDDLLCLPYCRVEHLEHQLRTAMRVLGPLRGRALLSDEVGLGKTIEAGLIIKELLTRGMIKRFLVLTVPSLVDQWEEELDEKFSLATVTTNHADARSDPRHFWTENNALVASLHTLKQPAQLEIARQIQWDILVVDEAHYLRNRDSQAWQAVNCLPRQYLLLLTATPVQNSIEELYNLVTLLQPGQLPSPKEFRARFINPKRPREPREPEELRRLLGQVMIRNTRANAGIKLPPRHAETVLFEPDENERGFWQRWETEFRAQLSRMKASQSSLWGRLLLQAAGSSPAAWLSALKKFPDAEAARAWRHEAPLESSWRKKCDLIPPLTRSEGGAVVFTQFLDTQAALADSLRSVGVEAFVVNGSTPAPERQPITEEFKKRGGALLLTHSGSEGRNLQFCHHLVNFDLPWNPMEIEQRIGRLHRLGQEHPVRIHNFVQAGTLQEHLLDILQEKLNLFELVVGETGLVLGERFSSDEFAEEVFRRWSENEGRVAEALAGLGEELAAARDAYGEIKKLEETLFTQNYESL